MFGNVDDLAGLLPGNVRDKAATQSGNMGSTGSMNRASPLLGGAGSAVPTWQGSPQKHSQSANSNSKLMFMRTFI